MLSVDRSRPRRAGAVLAAVLLVLSVGPAAACGDDTTDTAAPVPAEDGEFSGYVRDPQPDVGTVTVPAADGTPVAMAAEPGGIRLVYFGYTFCPDVCPTTMSDVKRALASLPPEQRERVQVDMVTIDPARDTGEKLTEYVTTFVPDATALRTDDPAALRAAASAFGANYSVEPGPEGEPEVSHTAELYAVDDTGRLVLVWPFGTTYEDLGADLSRLLAGERPPLPSGAGSSGAGSSTVPSP
jgi:protein SCO1/2